MPSNTTPQVSLRETGKGLKLLKATKFKKIIILNQNPN